MRVGLISDVHGNRIAVDAVVAHGTSRGVEAWWALGDLAAIGPDPVPTLELLVGLPGVRFVRGNTDRYVVTGDRPPPSAEDADRDPELRRVFDAVESSFAWTHDVLDRAGWLPWLANLPDRQRVVLADGTSVVGVHASPSSDDGAGITPATPAPDLQAMLASTGADVICAGHTHQPTDRRVGGGRAVNLGSVSNPVTTDLRASYVIIDTDRNGHTLRHWRVAYDHRAVLERLRHSTHPQASYIADFQLGRQVRFAAER
jgi:predicted phosphodiesterase